MKADSQLSLGQPWITLLWFLFAFTPFLAHAQTTIPSTVPASQPAIAPATKSTTLSTTAPSSIPSSQPTPTPAAQPATNPSTALPIAPELTGRTVEAIRILGNRSVSNAIILNVVRTREGQPFDPATIEEDYQRIFNLKRFSSVQAQVEPTPTGVIVVFIVNEQKLLTSIAYKGNDNVSTESIQEAADLKKGDAIDRFRITLARQAIETLYREKNYPYAHVTYPEEPLIQRGELIFNIVEGPEVRIRKVDFIGNNSFTADRLLDQIKTRSWIWIFRAGKLDEDELEEDVSALRTYYFNKGYFDVRVGRKIIVSPDQTEVQVNFIINEGVRYIIDRVTFTGAKSVPEAKLRANLNLHEGEFWDDEVLQRDIREIVKAYSPFGFVYVSNSENPDYLRIRAKHLLTLEPGHVELRYDIAEGKPFKLGRVIVSGNIKSQDKLVLREMRVEPGQLYNSSELQEAEDRIKQRPYFQSVQMTPIGEGDEVRDVLVEVQEAKTAIFSIGAAVSSDGGIGGTLTFEQKNFDIANWPSSATDVFAEHAFTGGGQNLRISLEPGTQQTNASISFEEPYLLDQPYSFFTEAYRRSRFRERYEETHVGDRTGIGKRFDYVYSASVALKGEDVNIHDIDTPRNRPPELLDVAGHSTLTSAAFTFTRSTLVGGELPYKGSFSSATVEQFGALGGDYGFRKYSGEWSFYQLIGEDLLDRKTILNYRANTGFITGDAPLFEKFYGGGSGSLRGFDYRGVSPRAGREDDRIGGNFALTGTVELSFPLAGDILRGVVFTDAGTVEPDVKIGTVRLSAGAGIRLILPIAVLNKVPIAVDLGFPLRKARSDDTRIISFSLGFAQ